MCFGPRPRLCHWGPVVALGIIKMVTGMGLYCCQFWWPTSTWDGMINQTVFISLSGLTLYNFLSAAFHGPGYLPLNWRPKDVADEKFMQYCGICQGFKAPRSHHCRTCNRCVIKMDHHCPWINNCVGWGNHAHFTAFLGFAVLGCAHATGILSVCLYKSIYRLWYIYHGVPRETIVHFGVYGMVGTVFSLGLAIGVVVAVGMLFYFQAKAILSNCTGIEDWIVRKAKLRKRNKDEEAFKFPYDLGYKSNLKQVLNWSCTPVGDGIVWTIADGCDQYTLTREQIEQKEVKRQRTKLYRIVRPASGSWVPICQGFRVLYNIPISDEPRIKLEMDDKVLVTRWHDAWLFGEKVQMNLPEGESAGKRIRGWFPRRCAVPHHDPHIDKDNHPITTCM